VDVRGSASAPILCRTLVVPLLVAWKSRVVKCSNLSYQRYFAAVELVQYDAQLVQPRDRMSGISHDSRPFRSEEDFCVRYGHQISSLPQSCKSHEQHWRASLNRLLALRWCLSTFDLDKSHFCWVSQMLPDRLHQVCLQFRDFAWINTFLATMYSVPFLYVLECFFFLFSTSFLTSFVSLGSVPPCCVVDAIEVSDRT
jgi:hypothetical protein